MLGEIRLLIRSEKAEGDITFKKPEISGSYGCPSVGEDQDFEQHHRMKLWSATVLGGFFWVEWVQSILLVEIVQTVGDELLVIILSDPFREILRHQMLLVLFVSDEVGRYGYNLTQ